MTPVCISGLHWIRSFLVTCLSPPYCLINSRLHKKYGNSNQNIKIFIQQNNDKNVACKIWPSFFRPKYFGIMLKKVAVVTFRSIPGPGCSCDQLHPRGYGHSLVLDITRGGTWPGFASLSKHGDCSGGGTSTAQTSRGCRLPHVVTNVNIGRPVWVQGVEYSRCSRRWLEILCFPITRANIREGRLKTILYLHPCEKVMGLF